MEAEGHKHRASGQLPPPPTGDPDRSEDEKASGGSSSANEEGDLGRISISDLDRNARKIAIDESRDGDRAIG
jgi:hypothetical protein